MTARSTPLRSLARWFDSWSQVAPEGESGIDWLRAIPFLALHVACAADHRYAAYCAAMLHALLQTHAGDALTVHFLHGEDFPAEDLRRLRAAQVFAVACSSPQNAGKRLRLHVAGALSSLDRERMAPGAEPEQVIEVPVRTLDDVLTEARVPAGFDFLSVDVEGHELDVLSGFDFARWRPRLILLEDHVGNLAKHRFLKCVGYRLIRRCENNGWYVPRDAAAAVAPGDRWEIVRKYYLALPFRVARNASRWLRQPIKDWMRRRSRGPVSPKDLVWTLTAPMNQAPARCTTRAGRGRQSRPVRQRHRPSCE